MPSTSTPHSQHGACPAEPRRPWRVTDQPGPSPERPRALSPSSPVCISASQQAPSLSSREGFGGHLGVHVGVLGSWWGSPLVATLEDQSPLPCGLSALQL